jgi:hypothetical protein
LLETPATNTAPPAAAPPSANQQAAAPKSDDGDKVVCKSTMETGSHFSSRVCHSKHDWAAIQKDSKDTFSDFQTKSGELSLNGK